MDAVLKRPFSFTTWILSSRSTAFLTEWLILLLVFGYPLQTMIPVLLKVESRPINTGFRVVYLAVSLYLILISLFRRNTRLTVPLLLFLLFWLLYGYRLISDISFKGKTYLEEDAFFVYSFAFGGCLAPALAVFLNAKFIKIRRIVINFWGILCLANLAIMVNLLLFAQKGFAALFLERANATGELYGKKITVINPITIGLFGEVLALLCIVFLLFDLIKTTKFVKFLYWLALALGLLNLVLGASRGPFLSFALLLFYVLYVHGKLRRKSTLYFVRLLAWSVAIATTILIYVVPIWSTLDFELLNRLTNFSKSRQYGEKEVRDYEWASAIHQFTENPIFGDSFVTDYDKSYAHNLFMDALMSTGIVGILLMSSLILFIFRRYNTFKPEQRSAIFPIWIIFLVYFLLSMTSGGLFMSFPFWIMSAMILSCSVRIF